MISPINISAFWLAEHMLPLGYYLVIPKKDYTPLQFLKNLYYIMIIGLNVKIYVVNK